jgi:hypothetical protein
VPRNKDEIQGFTELQYLEVLRKASARNNPDLDMTLGAIAEAIGVPSRKLKQFMKISKGFTLEMAKKYAEHIKVPAKILNRVGRSLFKEEIEKPKPAPKKTQASKTDWEAIKKRASEKERKRRNPYDKGPIDLNGVRKVVLTNYMEETFFMVCHLEEDGTLKMSLIPNGPEEVNENPYTREPIPGERVVMIASVPYGKNKAHVTEAHVPVRKSKS